MSGDVAAIDMARRARQEREQALDRARECNRVFGEASSELEQAVRDARILGVSELRLADTLGVSRTRIRTLARAEGEHE